MLYKSLAHQRRIPELVGGVLTGKRSLVVWGERPVWVAQWELADVVVAGCT